MDIVTSQANWNQGVSSLCGSYNLIGSDYRT